MHSTDTALNEYADGSLDPRERPGVEQHLTTCAACRRVVDDLREILRATGELEVREPPVRAWSRLERAVTLEREHATHTPRKSFGARGIQPSGSDASLDARLRGSGSNGSRSSGSRFRVSGAARLAATAALVLTTVVGLRYVPSRGPDATSSGTQGATPSISGADAAQSIETELRQAEAHYENAIRGLEAIANSERRDLDPRTAATLQKNLAIIDQAISESRAAVRSQPSSEPAQQSLIDGFKTKIGLLQDTVALINDMRKGNEAGAARIASGLRQKGN